MLLYYSANIPFLLILQHSCGDLITRFYHRKILEPINNSFIYYAQANVWENNFN